MQSHLVARVGVGETGNVGLPLALQGVELQHVGETSVAIHQGELRRAQLEVAQHDALWGTGVLHW